jgi:hypothetical protein
MSEEMTWRSIDSAPKDGSAVLLWSSLFRTEPKLAQWLEWHDNLTDQDRQGWREGVDFGDWLQAATHWMPLPPPPSAPPDPQPGVW